MLQPIPGLRDIHTKTFRSQIPIFSRIKDRTGKLQSFFKNFSKNLNNFPSVTHNGKYSTKKWWKWFYLNLCFISQKCAIVFQNCSLVFERCFLLFTKNVFLADWTFFSHSELLREIVLALLLFCFLLKLFIESFMMPSW